MLVDSCDREMLQVEISIRYEPRHKLGSKYKHGFPPQPNISFLTYTLRLNCRPYSPSSALPRLFPRSIPSTFFRITSNAPSLARWTSGLLSHAAASALKRSFPLAYAGANCVICYTIGRSLFRICAFCETRNNVVDIAGFRRKRGTILVGYYPGEETCTIQ